MASHSDKDTPPLIGRTLRRLNTYVLRLPEVEDASPSLCRSLVHHGRAGIRQGCWC
jgi:hypothetical protein